MIFKETLTLANGVTIPQLALGTWLCVFSFDM